MTDIEDKIEKLLAHAESAEELGSKEEAQAFFDEAERLARQYHLELDDLQDDESETELGRGEIKPTDYGEEPKSQRTIWIARVADAVGRAHGALVVSVVGSNRFHVFGEEVPRKATELVFNRLIPEVKRLAENAYERAYNKGGAQPGFFSAFYDGFASGLEERLHRVSDEHHDQDTERALVLREKAIERAKDFAREELHGVRSTDTVKDRTGYHNDAAKQGYDAAQGVDLGSRAVGDDGEDDPAALPSQD